MRIETDSRVADVLTGKHQAEMQAIIDQPNVLNPINVDNALRNNVIGQTRKTVFAATSPSSAKPEPSKEL